MGISIGTLIGQLIPLVLFIVAIVVAIRCVLAATRLMNRKAELLQRELESGEQRDGERSEERAGTG